MPKICSYTFSFSISTVQKLNTNLAIEISNSIYAKMIQIT